MPEMSFQIRWPDDALQQCYSPSLVIKDHLEVGANYPLAEFMKRVRLALTIASDRVRIKHGFACSRAMNQLASLEAEAVRCEKHANGTVTVLSFEE